MNKSELLRKYNVPGPRYTSYPTVPFWNNDLTGEIWLKEINHQMEFDKRVSLYIHLPFCESLCTYCGCNTRITTNHNVERPYIDAVIKEWQMYIERLESIPIITELHLGGGTPTFFSAENLDRLMNGILSVSQRKDGIAFSFEGHPQNTTIEHLKLLHDWGFTRVSFGIQDFDKEVQRVINRKQSFEKVREVTLAAREIGYSSVNYDLIYGLPKQKLSGIIDTIEKVNLLKPDRIAFYSYAHVPWLKPGQRSFTIDDLPSGEVKLQLYEMGKAMLIDSGYIEIGMDHFALKSDSLFEAYSNNSLHRNFMGYTDVNNKLLIGLGVSAISDSWNAFSQNEKIVERYYESINRNEFPIIKGHILNSEDLLFRKHILNIMCRFETNWSDQNISSDQLNSILEKLKELELDDLISLHPNSLKVTSKGKAFLRNICMAFDARLHNSNKEKVQFSSTV